MTSSPVRVLVVQPSPVRGGAEECLVELVTRADPAKLSITVACLADGPFVDDLEALGAAVVHLRAQRLRYVWMWALTVWRLARLARKHDVVLSWQVKGNYYGAPAGRLARKPVTWWDHGIRPAKGEPRYWVDNVLPSLTRADVIFTSSAVSASRHQRSKAILPRPSIQRTMRGSATNISARSEFRCAAAEALRTTIVKIPSQSSS